MMASLLAEAITFRTIGILPVAAAATARPTRALTLMTVPAPGFVASHSGVEQAGRLAEREQQPRVLPLPAQAAVP